MKPLYIFLLALPLAALAQGINGPEQDCEFAIPICNLSITQTVSYQGFGQSDDLIGINSCLDNNENNSVWYKLEIATSGILSFTITAANNNDDYDFALYNFSTLTCQDLHNGNITETRCNYAFSPGETGMKSGFTNTSEGPGGLAFVAPLNVTAGQVYYLLVDNFSSTSSGFSIDFSSGTTSFSSPQNSFAVITKNLSCAMDSVIEINFPLPLQCGSVASDGSDFIITGPSTITIDSAYSLGCNGPGVFTSVILNYSGTLINNGTYQLIVKQGTDGNALLGTCFNLTDTITILFEREPIQAEAGFRYLVSGNIVNLTDTSRFATSLLWDLGSGPQDLGRSPNLTLNNGTYNVCLIAGNYCSSDTVCHTIVVDSNAYHIYVNNLVCDKKSVIEIHFSKQLYCNSVAADGSDLLIVGPTVISIDSAYGDRCGSNNTFYSVILHYSGTLLYDTTYQLIIKEGTDGDALVGSISSLPSSDTLEFTPNYLYHQITANFSYSLTNSNVHFDNLSSGAWTSFSWYFSDGYTTNSNNPNVSWNNGTYVACLIARNHCSIDTLCKTVVVGNIDTIGCIASFELYPDTIPHYYYAINNASGTGPISYLWSWGDGTTDTGPYPSHTYSSSGNYPICLTITDSTGCMDVSCSNYQLMKAEQTMIYINVIPSPDTTVGIFSSNESMLSLFPNPTNGIITIHWKDVVQDNLKMEVFNTLGKRMHCDTYTFNGKILLDLNSFDKGIYFVRLYSGTGFLTRKFILAD